MLSLANLETLDDVYGNADMDDSCNLDYCNDECSSTYWSMGTILLVEVVNTEIHIRESGDRR